MDAKEMLQQLLNKRASEDALFAKTMSKENKTIDECWKYVLSEARKLAVEGSCAMTDDEVVSIAVHYYDEDELVIDEVKNVKVSRVAEIEDATDPDKFPGDDVRPVQPSKVAKNKKKVVEDDLQMSLF